MKGQQVSPSPSESQEDTDEIVVEAASPSASEIEDEAEEMEVDENGEDEEDKEYEKDGEHKVVPTMKNPSSVIILIVQEEDRQTEFIVYKEFACFYSTVLSTAFEGDSVEGQRQIYRLENTTEGAVRLLSLWFYRETLEINAVNEAWRRDNEGSDAYYDVVDKDEEDLIDLWLLADKFSIFRLQNAAMEALDKLYIKHVFNFPPVQHVYGNADAGSKLRQFVVMRVAYTIHNAKFEETPKDFPLEFLIDLAVFSTNTIQADKGEQSKTVKNYLIPV